MMEIRDANVHRKGNERWVALPSKFYQDSNNETKYAYIVKFTDKKRWAKFQQETLHALDEYISRNQTPKIPDADIPFQGRSA
jgi:hypothetical protein